MSHTGYIVNHHRLHLFFPSGSTFAVLRQAPEPFLAVSLEAPPPLSSPSSFTFALSPSSPSPLRLGTSLLQKKSYLSFLSILGSALRFSPDSLPHALRLCILSFCPPKRTLLGFPQNPLPPLPPIHYQSSIHQPTNQPTPPFPFTFF